MKHIGFPIAIEGVGNVVMVLEIYHEGGETVCGIYDMRGAINLPPKQWLRIVREQIGKIEEFAKDSGVTEIRLGGRDWSPILKDYEPFNAIPNGLRKRLH